MSPKPPRSSSHRSSASAGPSSMSGISGLLRRFSTSSYQAGDPAVDPASLLDNQIHNVLFHPASPPTVHEYILLRSAFIIVKSHALNNLDSPLLYFGEDIMGCVILSHSDVSDIQSINVVLQVFGSDPIIPCFEVKRTSSLSSQQVQESQFSGKSFCWPFTIAPSTGSIPQPSPLTDSGYESSNGHGTGGGLNFQLIVTIYRRARLARNVEVKKKIVYVPRPSPTLRSSPAQISVNLPGDVAPIPTLAPSWPQQRFPPVIVRGVIFGRVHVEVECKLVTPSEYPANDGIPLRLFLTSENYEALDLFSVSQAIDVRMQKVVDFGKRAGNVRPLNLRDHDEFHRAEPAATANWVRDGDFRKLPQDEHHTRPRWRVKLNGAFQRARGVELGPSYEEPGVTMAITYFVSFYTFCSPYFQPAHRQDKALVIGKIKLNRPS